MHVLVLNKNLQPMMPCHPARARILLKNGRARVYRQYPFTIVVVDREEFEVQEVELKVDPGSKTTGLVLVARFERGNEVLWAAHLEHRGHLVKQALDHRRQMRRSRRNRKTRYRPCRFSNRTRSPGWLPPSLMSGVNNVCVWGHRLVQSAPVTRISVEIVRFDTQKLQDPEIHGIEYQQGTLFGYEVREYLLEKYHHTCVYCGAQQVPLEIEHLIPKSRAGSDRLDNLAIACHTCNQLKGSMTAAEFGYPQLMAQAAESFRDAAAVNATRFRIGAELKELGLLITLGSGGQTKMNRIRQNYPKEHWIDAACVGDSGQCVVLNPHDRVLTITAMGRGSRQMCRMNRYGFPRTQPKAAKRVHGFQTGDMVELTMIKGKYQGVYQGKVVVRTRGNFDIITNTKQKISASWQRFRLLQRLDGYSYRFHRLTPSV
jgi:5-methylcytosine-specific restriction endonuclease McrA